MKNTNDISNVLAAHVIEKVSFYQTRSRYPRLHGRNAGKGIHGYGTTIVIAHITTNLGFSGWGSAMCIYDLGSIAFERSDIKGKRLTEVFDADIGILDDRYQIYDLALHDLAGKILGIPVSKLLRPDAINQVPVYDGAIYMNDLIDTDHPSDIETVLYDCQCDYALGHRAFKVKIGRGHMWLPWDDGMARDIAIIKGIAQRWPDVKILVDANDGYTPETMIEFCNAILPINLYWIEEPFIESEERDRILKSYLKTAMPECMIADGENKPNISLLLELGEKRLVDVIQPDVIEFGFTNWRKLIKRMELVKVLGSPHAWGDVIKTHYCTHLAAAYPNLVPTIEAVLGDTEGVDHSGYTLENGVLNIPQRPGFGMDFIWGEEI